MKKEDFLRIKHRLNARYANRSDFLMEKHLNQVNIELQDCMDLLAKKKLKLRLRVDDLKIERENMSPQMNHALDLYDDMIQELEQLAFSKEKSF